MLRIRSAALSVDEAMRAVRRDDCGAVCIFVGTVRDHNRERRVAGIDYSAYAEMADKEIAKLEAEASRRWRIGAVYAAHRTGRLDVGDASVVVAVSAPHRAEAFEACRFVIEALKKTAPIWKEEFYGDSGKAWIGGE